MTCIHFPAHRGVVSSGCECLDSSRRLGQKGSACGTSASLPAVKNQLRIARFATRLRLSYLPTTRGTRGRHDVTICNARGEARGTSALLHYKTVSLPPQYGRSNARHNPHCVTGLQHLIGRPCNSVLGFLGASVDVCRSSIDGCKNSPTWETQRAER